MKFKNKLMLGASFLGLLAPNALVQAQETEAIQDDSQWQARNVNDVVSEIIRDNNGNLTYTIQAGDTLSVIAEAFSSELEIFQAMDRQVGAQLMQTGSQITAHQDVNDLTYAFTVETVAGDSFSFDTLGNHQANQVSSETVLAPVQEWVETESEPTVSQVNVSDSANQSKTLVEEVPEWTANEPSQPAIGGNEQVVTTDVAPANQLVTDSAVSTDQASFLGAETEADLAGEVTPVSEELPVSQSGELNPAGESTPSEESHLETNNPVELEVTNPEVITSSEAEVETAPAESTVESVSEEVVATPAEAIDPYANPENAGLTADAAAYKEKVGSMYGVEDYSLYRAGDPGDHGQGKAVDFMVYDDVAKGNAIANYSIENMAANNISYVIWQQQIYGDWNRQWTPMEDRGSVTANHYDHVHVSFN
ncbi:LysM peptidoglycan-binding domain-containing protein [Hutsoniella sourekii]|uniref:LysM peptidoglycan-binding domain-containing protein n=1 Tax=Hutsoniella sourekii TaxID=87650 RepID=UPI0004B15E4F|nr:LysM domain-containing protein [Hutsoniella sourekii]